MSTSADDFKDRISSWSDLSDLVEHFSYFIGYDWLFRGVTEATHGLIPKIGRETSRKKRSDGSRVPYSVEDERAIFSMFKQQARAHVPVAPKTDLEWLSVAQHFGLPTRLLDWTEGLLVAAWFAVEKGGAKKTDSAIWVTKRISNIDVDDARDPLAIGEAVAYRAPYISPRIGAQGSVLLICPEPAKELSLTFAKRVTIDRSMEFTLKKRLNACGISRRSLFPDLGGLSDHLAWLYKNDWLAGYKSPKSFWEESRDEPPDETAD